MSITEAEADRLMNMAIEIMALHYANCRKCSWEETEDGAVIHHVVCRKGKKALARINAFDKWLLDMDEQGQIEWKDDKEVSK